MDDKKKKNEGKFGDDAWWDKLYELEAVTDVFTAGSDQKVDMDAVREFRKKNKRKLLSEK